VEVVAMTTLDFAAAVAVVLALALFVECVRRGA